MAGSIFLPLKAIFDDKGIKEAQASFSKLGKSVKGALGAVGIGLSFGAITAALTAAGKAAAGDAKSQGLLANALVNTVGATDLQIAAVEKSISKMESMSAVADDNIRPAFAQLARVTGDVGKATELTSLALDVAAGTGRDLSAVSIALGKAFQGNTASLAKLGINVKGVKDPLAALTQQFAGSAEAAARLDPYQRLEIAMGNIQEQIGSALLPAMNRLADLFNSEEFQNGIGQVAEDFANFVTGLIVVGDQVDKTVNQINTALAKLGIDNRADSLSHTLASRFQQVSNTHKTHNTGSDSPGNINLASQHISLLRQPLQHLALISRILAQLIRSTRQNLTISQSRINAVKNVCKRIDSGLLKRTQFRCDLEQISELANHLASVSHQSSS